MSFNEETARKELGDHFHAAVTEHSDVMAECLRAKLATLTLDTIRELKKEIQREQQAKAVASFAPTTDQPQKSSVGVRKGKGNMSDIGGLLSPQPFHSRPQPHSLIETLNPHLPPATPLSLSSKQRIALSSTADPKNWNYRYMFEKISQRSEALDDLIDDYAESIKDAYGISELGDPHFVSEESIYTVGRILSPPTDSSKATSTSLYLESSRLLGAGKRIALRFTTPNALKVRGGAPGVKGFGLFPGCLVCVKGRNGGGGAFVVEEVLMTPVDELLSFQHGEKLSGQPLSLMTAAGPFTLDDDLSYAPLDALVNVVRDERPDLGPFVDAQHPLIATGAVTQTPLDIFKDQISRRLHTLVESSPGTVIILVPSVRDLVSRHMAFPQSMLEKDTLGLPKKVKLLPNPCTFSINEILISLSSVDVLFHLRREELFQKAEEVDPDPELKGTEVKDAMAGLVRHVLGQRNFYPIFPPPEIHAADINLDIVDSTLVVNPAHLARAHSAGTYAKVTIHPTARSELESGEDYTEHKVWDRARSEIWRI
ncbi:hypothetical protein CI109_102199 [Kwoniella shandongensis]|uniref:DNA polymerase alpha subunit B n=1 Tax=Kwoniella shandongensis TaxID=1734106 RepID=A0AAJ8LEP7_9TREE